MPINTTEKRRAASKIMKIKPGVTPTAAKDQEWRQQSGRSYSGILAGGVAPAEGTVHYGHQARSGRTRTHLRRR